MGFPWLAAAIFSSAVIGFTSSKSAADSAENAAQAQLDFSMQLYNDYKAKYGPLEDKLLAELSRPLEQQTAYKAARGEVIEGYGNLDSTLRRRFGTSHPYGSGLERGARTGAAIGHTRNLGQLRLAGEANRQQNLLGMLQLGKGMSGPETNLANVYSQRTQISGANAATAGQGFSDFAGNLSMMYMLRNPTGSGLNLNLVKGGRGTIDPGFYNA